MSFLYDKSGKRKYLTINERKAFLRAAEQGPPEVYTFCATLAYTGARISEILALKAENFDFSEQLIVIQCLKKRRSGTYRSVPVPQKLLTLLDKVHSIKEVQRESNNQNACIWSCCRTTAWKYVKSTMAEANIRGVHATPKGLRHCFGVSAVQHAVPLNMVRKWLGHSRLSTTAIYTDASGQEEQEIAKLLWNTY